MTPAIRLAAIAARQRSVFRRDQAYGVGFTKWMVLHELESGRWGRVYRDVFRLAGSTPNWEQAVTAAWLAAGRRTVVSGLSAARLHSLPVPDGPIEVTVPADRCVRLRRVKVSRRDLPPVDIGRCACLLATTPTRTALDLCSSLSIRDLVRLFDALFGRQLSSPAFALSRLDELAASGRRGVVMARQILARYPIGKAVPDWRQERALITLLEQLGVDLTPQVVVELTDGRLLHPDVGVGVGRAVVELQSYEHHSSPEAFAQDNERAMELAAVGRVWCPITPWDVQNRPTWVLDRVARAADLSSLKPT